MALTLDIRVTAMLADEARDGSWLIQKLVQFSGIPFYIKAPFRSDL